MTFWARPESTARLIFADWSPVSRVAPPCWLSSPLGPILREIEAVYHNYRKRGGLDQARTRAIMHEQMREWLLCCNPSNYTLPLLLDGLSETMVDDQPNRHRFVSEAQNILRKAGALR